MPAVDPLPLLLQHLLPVTRLRSTHPTHPPVHVLTVPLLLVTFSLLLAEDGGGDGGEGGGVSEVAPGETEDGFGDGDW